MKRLQNLKKETEFTNVATQISELKSNLYPRPLNWSKVTLTLKLSFKILRFKNP